MTTHPLQPLHADEYGVVRFQKNGIVRYLLDNGGLTLNDLARIDFPQNDWEQFYQLIGYSLGGYGDLSMVSQASIETAQRMHDHGQTESNTRIAHLEEKLHDIREALKAILLLGFNLHTEAMP